MIETIGPDVQVAKDASGRAWLIQHPLDPWAPELPDQRPRDCVTRYLGLIGDLLGIPSCAIAHLDSTGNEHGADGDSCADAGLRLRWAASFPLRGEVWVFLLQQTQAVRLQAGRISDATIGLDVEGAGVRISVETRAGVPFAIRGIESTLAHDLPAPPTRVIDLEPLVDDLACASMATFDPKILPRVLKIALSGGGGVEPYQAVRSPSAACNGSLRDPASVVPIVSTRPQPIHPPPSQPPAQTVAGSGLVLRRDPVTETANWRVRPNAGASVLNPRRMIVTLERLKAPPAGSTGFPLDGTRVGIVGGNPNQPPGATFAAPPSAPLPAGSSGPRFLYEARSNEFAAVNAYYHCENVLSLLDRLDLPLSSFPMVASGAILPRIEVIPRATMRPTAQGDGNEVNAQLTLQPEGGPLPQRLQFRFALADLSRNPGSPKHPVEPLGIACDARIVAHEWGHALLAASTGEFELPFAHSVGDALAAIISDPDSSIARRSGVLDPERFVTYPWGTSPNRRHDRSPSRGWSWSGPLGTDHGYSTDMRDRNGYAREQVMSTTLFRYYRAIGGDATQASRGQGLADRPHVLLRRVAAFYSCYIVIRAVASLGPASIVPARNAAVFADAMRRADLGTCTAPGTPIVRGGPLLPGGLSHKVIAWAFEQQGLPSVPTFPGALPPDVFIAGPRNGGYGWTETWQACAHGIWNRRMPDGGRTDEAASAGVKNFLYVAVRNRLKPLARNVSVLAYTAPGAAELYYPDKSWVALQAGAGSLAPQSQQAGEEELVFGPFEWTPCSGSNALFVAVEAWGDRSNINPAARSPCARIPAPAELLVRFDNNLALRVIEAC